MDIALDDKPPFDPEAEEEIAAFFASARLRRSPWEYCRELRERAPIYYSRNRKMWIVTGYRLVEQVLRAPQSQLKFHQRMDAVRPGWRDHPSSANQIPFIAFADGADHARLRRPLSPAWMPKALERFRPMVRNVAGELVADFVQKGGGDFSTALAYPLAEHVIYHLFALDSAGLPDARTLVDTMLLTWEYDANEDELARADAAAIKHRAFWQAEIGRRAEDPSGEDMLSQLLHEDSFTMRDVAEIAESLFLAGFGSTAVTATTGMWVLLQHPDQVERARADEGAMERLPEELLRLASAVPMTLRVAADDLSIGGFTIRANELVGVVLGAANRDPLVFADPEKLDLNRPPARSLAFSYGPHACLGQWLARIELFELYKALLSATRDIKVVTEPRFRDRQSSRGIEELVLSVA